jgi:hypothetical protein
MSRTTYNGSNGNDGSWFLEAVGAKERQPTPIESVAELEAENTAMDIGVMATVPAQALPLVAFDGDPGTSTSSFHPVPSLPPPPTLDDQPTTEPSETAKVPSSPEDADLAAVVRSRRRFRWPVLIVLVTMIALVAVAAWWLPRSVQDQALVVRQGYYDAAADLRAFLPTAQTGLDAITNPASDDASVSGAVPIVAEFDTKAFALASTTAESLPSVPPLVPSTPVDDLVPLKATGSILGAAASDLARSLGGAYVYRTSIPLLLDTGPLPTSATTQEVNEISVRLAESLATDAGILADLPDQPAFAEVLVGATTSAERYATWQDEYLASLTGEDPGVAATLIEEIDDMRATLDALNGSALLDYRTQADGAIVTLADELDAYLVAVSRP